MKKQGPRHKDKVLAFSIYGGEFHGKVPVDWTNRPLAVSAFGEDQIILGWVFRTGIKAKVWGRGGEALVACFFEKVLIGNFF